MEFTIPVGTAGSLIASIRPLFDTDIRVGSIDHGRLRGGYAIREPRPGRRGDSIQAADSNPIRRFRFPPMIFRTASSGRSDSSSTKLRGSAIPSGWG